MNCFDCGRQGRDSAAVAICHDCGAGICSEHAVVRGHHLSRTTTINRIIVVEPPARVVRCEICTAAHDAAHADMDVTGHHHRVPVQH